MTDFEPADPAAAGALGAMIDQAFGQSLESLRRWVEKGERWHTM